MEGGYPPPIGAMGTIRVGGGLYQRGRPASSLPIPPRCSLSCLVDTGALHDDLQHHYVDALEEGTILQGTHVQGLGNLQVRL
eukprot:4411412-Alexandrium_andersonii.AAC.1